MPAMTEAEVYQRLTKDGDSLGSIKKNTEMLRQHFTIEAQRVAHALSQLDPYNQDRHAAEAERIYQENNAVLDRVLMQIASTSPQKMPLPIEVINKASEATNISKSQAKAILTFPFVLLCAFPAAFLYAIGFFCMGAMIALGVAVLNALTLKLDMSGISGSVEAIGFPTIAKVVYGLTYLLTVFVGFSHVRGGGSFGDVFEELFLKPVGTVLEMINGFTSGFINALATNIVWLIGGFAVSAQPQSMG